MLQKTTGSGGFLFGAMSVFSDSSNLLMSARMLVVVLVMALLVTANTVMTDLFQTSAEIPDSPLFACGSA